MTALGQETVDSIDEEARKAFKQAVQASQPNLALHHLVTIVSNLQERIDELEEKVEAKKAKSRKTSSKKSSSKKKKKSDNDDDDE